MSVLFSILFGFCLFGLVACLYMAVRNQAVYNYRVKVLSTDMDKYERLPSYNTMMYKFWVWPMSRFDKQAQAQQPQNVKLVK